MGDVKQLRSPDAEVIGSILRSVVPTSSVHRMDRVQGGVDWRSVTIPGLTVVDYTVTADMRAAARPADEFHVWQVTAPRVRFRVGRRALDTSRPCAAAHDEISAAWGGDARVRGMVFDLPTVEQAARRLSGVDTLRLRLTDHVPGSEALGTYWSTVCDHVAATLFDGGHAHPVIESEMRRYALQTVLRLFPSTLWDVIDRGPQPEPGNATVRRAKAFIDEHAHEPITVDDVATAVHISTRGLQYAFKRATGESPMQYLRRARLAGAHAELQSTSAASIGEVAARWGFAHRSRFAQYYREQYGHSPRETIGAAGSARPSLRPTA